jgi:bacterioferritin-associated ferredoxin
MLAAPPIPGVPAVYVCICFAVEESELADVIAAGARSEEEVGNACGAGTGCGSCLDRICDRLQTADGLAIAA